MQNLLRPQTFKKFIGQEKLKRTLKVMIGSAQARKKSVDHILVHGGPGLGKTTLATIIANEMKVNIRYAQGPLLEKKADILALFGSVQKHEIIFIDEIHGINKNVEELIYSVLEDGVIDIMIGPEGDSKIVRMKVPSFTLIGATTKITRVSKPLRDRFGLNSKLMSYSTEDIAEILINSSKSLKLKIEDDAIQLLSNHCRENPRVANNLLKRSIDFSYEKKDKMIDKKVVKNMFLGIGIYKFGFTDQHIDYLKCLSDTLSGKYVSLDTVSSVLGENKDTIEKEIEPLSIRFGLIEKSSRGRRISIKGERYLTTYNLNN